MLVTGTHLSAYYLVGSRLQYLFLLPFLLTLSALECEWRVHPVAPRVVERARLTRFA